MSSAIVTLAELDEMDFARLGHIGCGDDGLRPVLAYEACTAPLARMLQHSCRHDDTSVCMIAGLLGGFGLGKDESDRKCS